MSCWNSGQSPGTCGCGCEFETATEKELQQAAEQEEIDQIDELEEEFRFNPYE